MAKKQKQSLLHTILRGRVLSSDLFTRHWLFVITLLAVVMLYITDKYENQTSMEEIRRLNGVLEVAKTECVRARSAFMSRTRESRMQHLVDSLSLGLYVQDCPPYKLPSESR